MGPNSLAPPPWLSFAALTVLHCFMASLTFCSHMGNKAIKTNKKIKEKPNTRCCNSFHITKGVEPQWNYLYSGASRWLSHMGQPQPGPDTPEKKVFVHKKAEQFTVGWFDVTGTRSLVGLPMPCPKALWLYITLECALHNALVISLWAICLFPHLMSRSLGLKLVTNAGV